MHKGTTALLVLVVGITSGSAFPQTSSDATHQSSTTQQDPVPVFRVTVVGRTTPAINYRPRSGKTEIGFEGTALTPRARGEARVEGEKGVIAVDARFDELPPASRFGREYLTYVLWAITPEGRATNLGELQVDGEDAELEVTTELQAFGLIVTAEPYFAVTQPSDVVIMENVVREDTVGTVEVIQANYELLKRGTYLMNQDPGRLRVKEIEPGVTLDLAEARNALELARLAGADRFAAQTFAKAVRLLGDAEAARERRRGGDAVMMPARQAVQTAEDARLIALQKQEEAFIAEQRDAARRRESIALERARAEEARRLRAEEDRLAAEHARTAAETAARRLAAERTAAEAARDAAERARRAAEAHAQEVQANAARIDREKAELRERLREQLDVILETRETARGLIVNMSDVLFDTGSATLTPGAREKLARVAGVLLSYPGLQIEIGGHTDRVGAEDYNQRLSESRAEAVRTYLVRQGIRTDSVTAHGFGEREPVVSNNTAAGRQQNRRVELVVSGELIDSTTLTAIRREE